MGLESVTTTTQVGWDFLNDLSQAWLGIQLLENSTFPQPSSLTLEYINVGYPLNPPVYETSPDVIIYSSTDTQFMGEISFIQDSKMDSQEAYFYGGQKDQNFPIKPVSFTSEKNEAKINTGNCRAYPMLPLFETISELTKDPSHWLTQKYNKDKIKVGMLQTPTDLESFSIVFNEFSVCSIPEFIQYLIPDAKQNYGGKKDYNDSTNPVKINTGFTCNMVVLYAENDGVFSLVSASEISPPITSSTTNNRFLFYFENSVGVTIV